MERKASAFGREMKNLAKEYFQKAPCPMKKAKWGIYLTLSSRAPQEIKCLAAKRSHVISAFKIWGK
jgi:hypothetical protein